MIPFSPSSDSLYFRWLINGEHDENELNAGMFYSFGDLGDNLVTAIVHDGAEVDMVEWSITVEDSNEVKGVTEGLLPSDITLYPPDPNPFNSYVILSFFLPKSTEIELSVLMKSAEMW